MWWFFRCSVGDSRTGNCEHSPFCRGGGPPSNYLKAGQRVRVEYGSLAGVEGVLVREGAKHRLIVSVELLQRAVSLHIDQDQITVL